MAFPLQTLCWLSLQKTIPTLSLPNGRRTWPKPCLFEQREFLFFTHRSSISLRQPEYGYKLLTRWYRVPKRLHCMFPDANQNCWKCGTTRCTLLHMFWSCPQIHPFWQGVCALKEGHKGLSLEQDTTACFLHLARSLSIDIATHWWDTSSMRPFSQ